MNKLELLTKVTKIDDFYPKLEAGISLCTKSSSKLILILRTRSLSFSDAIKDCSKRLKLDRINAGKDLSRLLISGLETPDIPVVMQHLINEGKSQFCVLDNADVFFDKDVSLDALALLRNLSKFCGLIACMDASLRDVGLVYGKPSQIDYKIYNDINDIFIIDAKGAFV